MAQDQKSVTDKVTRNTNASYVREVAVNGVAGEFFSKFTQGLVVFSAIPNMLGMDWLSRTLTPRGTNTPPAGVDADGVPLIEYYAKAMREAENNMAGRKVGQVIGMTTAMALGTTGPAGLAVMAVGGLLGAKHKPNWLRRMATPRGTNRQNLKIDLLAREMVTFTRAKLNCPEAEILGGKDVWDIANTPTAQPDSLTIKFDRILKIENRMPNPMAGPLHQLVQSVANYANQSAAPQNALKSDITDEDPKHPFYIAQAGDVSVGWRAATDCILALCGFPDRATAQTSLVMEIDRAAMRPVSTSEYSRAAETGAKLEKPVSIDRDWDKLPAGKIVTVGVRYNDEGIRTEAFDTRRINNEIHFIDRDGTVYDAAEFQDKVLSPRAPYLTAIKIADNRLIFKNDPNETPLGRSPTPANSETSEPAAAASPTHYQPITPPQQNLTF